MASTIRDIKNLTGLSLATISKYLNGGNVLPENRVKIEAAVKELHYEVNEMARGLVTSRSRTVGVVVFDIANVFTCTMLRYVDAFLREAGYAAMICDSHNDIRIEEENIRFLMNKKVDGLIVIPVAETSDFLLPALQDQIPVVLLDRSLQDERVDCVKLDNKGASASAMRLLTGCGHRKIALIGSDRLATGRERLAGCLKALEEEKIPLPDNYLKLGTHTAEHGYKAMKELLDLEDRPTAVFLGNFEIILGAVMALNESPLQCPRDISLIGFDDFLISNVSNPRLYLVVQPVQKMAREAVGILLDRMMKPKEQTAGEEHKELSFPADIETGESIARLCRA